MMETRTVAIVLATTLPLAACDATQPAESSRALPSVDAAAGACSAVDAAIVARIGDESITMGELDAFLMERLMSGVTGQYQPERLHRYRALGIERLVNERVVEAAVRSEGRSPREITEQGIEDGPPVRDEEVRAAFESRKHLLGSLSFEEVEEVIRQELATRQLRRNEDAFYERLRREAGAVLLLGDTPTPESTRPPALARGRETAQR